MGNFHSKMLDYDGTTGTVTSDAFDMFTSTRMGLHQKQTSGPTGVLTLLEASDGLNIEDSHDWQDTGIVFTALTGTVSQVWNIQNALNRWYAVRYTDTSGTGSGEVWITVKDEDA